MRPTAIFPLLCTFVAFILSLLCIFAGSRRGYIEQGDILTLNTSMLGRVTLNTSKTSSSLLNSIGSSIKGEVNDLIADVARQFNIHDFYSAHLLDYCEGYYTPSAFANATVAPHKNVTRCSNHTAMFHFDPTSVIQKELKPGISLDDLHWPSAIKNAVHAVEIASKAMFVLYVVGVAATGLALLGAFLGVLSGGRLAALLNNILAFLAFMALGIASAIASAIMSKVVTEVNKHGTDVGVTAAKGRTFQGMTWTATVLMFITAIAWIYEFVAHRRQQTSYVSSIYAILLSQCYTVTPFTPPLIPSGLGPWVNSAPREPRKVAESLDHVGEDPTSSHNVTKSTTLSLPQLPSI
ncbi:MAG: hypothetical protein Q9218_006636 [Villophora microphyllina]